MNTLFSGGRGKGPPQKHWKLTQYVDGFVLETSQGKRTFEGSDVAHLTVRHSWFRPAVKVTGGESVARLRGLNRKQSAALRRAIQHCLARARVVAELGKITTWHAQVLAAIDLGVPTGRWICEETIHDLEGSRPEGAYDVLAAVEAELGGLLTEPEKNAIDQANADMRRRISEVNESILTSELVERRAFFDKVEHSPLTEEQARAVACFDNRVQVIAAAGSGKTSIMVARAAYAVERGFIPADRILLLAFNRAAADELQARVLARLAALGIPSDQVKTDTFHAFGLGIIGQARGRKPRPAPWLENGQDVLTIARIIDELRERSQEFRFKWDIFRLLYARVSDSLDGGEPDSWDPAQRRTGYRTFRGEIVKSEGERLIADWLFLNGVDYRYEQPYTYDVADSTHSQYRPDFFYPQANVWHEHWALNSDGEPPVAYEGYADAMAWKRQLHRANGTTLIETTWAQIIDRSGFSDLAHQLRKLGIELDWNPDRPIPGADPVKHGDLARLVRTFMTHVKSNSLAPQSVERRMIDGHQAVDTSRTRLFLDLYWQIHAEWQVRLETADCVDFEDMLVQAAEHLERGDIESHYDLVLVDEFQDASHARARLVKALVDKPGTFLLAVGDDWQSVNRFAGADISVMTRFEQWFGRGQTLRLQTSFRCPQSICDASSTFVAKNPRQVRKNVTSARAGYGAMIQLALVAEKGQIATAISDYLGGLEAQLASGGIEPGPGPSGAVSVDILGRYKFDRQLIPQNAPRRVDVTFRTIHRSKGLEADYVVVPNLTNGLYGFPSQIVDDPVLDVVMSDPDGFPHAEERRLLYVALTRARRGVLLIAVSGTESPFVAELIDDQLLALFGGNAGRPVRVCPACRAGLLIERTGPYGAFLGCSGFPRCRHTEQMQKQTRRFR